MCSRVQKYFSLQNYSLKGILDQEDYRLGSEVREFGLQSIASMCQTRPDTHYLEQMIRVECAQARPTPLCYAWVSRDPHAKLKLEAKGGETMQYWLQAKQHPV